MHIHIAYTILPVSVPHHVLEIMGMISHFQSEQSIQFPLVGSSVKVFCLMAIAQLIIGPYAPLSIDPACIVRRIFRLCKGIVLRIGDELVQAIGSCGVMGRVVKTCASAIAHGVGMDTTESARIRKRIVVGLA